MPARQPFRVASYTPWAVAYSRAATTPPGRSKVDRSTGAGAPSFPSSHGLMNRALQSSVLSSPASTVAGSLQADRMPAPLTRTRTSTDSRDLNGAAGQGTSTCSRPVTRTT